MRELSRLEGSGMQDSNETASARIVSFYSVVAVLLYSDKVTAIDGLWSRQLLLSCLSALGEKNM